MGKFINLTGQQYGKWTVLDKHISIKNKTYWFCQCECGTQKYVEASSLKGGKSTNCGCSRYDTAKSKCDNLLGQTFNSLTVLERTNDGKWKCQCKCGNITYVTTSNLKNGYIKQCKDCGNKISAEKRTIDITGNKYGLLTVLEQVPSENGHTMWLCQCECGNKKIISKSSLTQGLTKSCGCQKSYGEYTIIKILKENNIPFKYQYYFNNCNFPDSNIKARFDFYVDNKYIIEYDGEQHFTYTNNGWCTKENFEKLQIRDKIKNQYCFDNNIPIIRIPYWHFNDLCLKDLLLETSSFILKP